MKEGGEGGRKGRQGGEGRGEREGRGDCYTYSNIGAGVQTRYAHSSIKSRPIT